MRRLFGGLIAAGTLLVAFPASAAADAYLELDGLAGASHGGKIELSSITYGGGRAVNSMPLGVGPERSDGHSMRASKPVDPSSRALWQAGQAGRRFAWAVVYVRNENGTFERYRLGDVVITGFDNNGQLSSNQTERFTLNFVTINRD